VPTNLAIDDRLIEEAQKLGRHRTKKETVNAALDEYIKHRKQQGILSLFGQIEYDSNYDYKRERGANCSDKERVGRYSVCVFRVTAKEKDLKAEDA